MIHKNIKYGNTDNVTVAEFGKGTMVVVNSGVDSNDEDYRESLLMKSVDTPLAIGQSNKTTGMTSDEWKPEMVIAFRNKESFDVFYEFVGNIRKRFHPEPTALDLIAAERERHETVEGWTKESDQKHTNGELARAAAIYALPHLWRTPNRNGQGLTPELWPKNWDPLMWKPTPDNRIKELVKAGALIAAEIDRLLHLETKDQ